MTSCCFGKFLLVHEHDMCMLVPDTSLVEYDHNVVEQLWDDSEKLELSEEVRKCESGGSGGDKSL